MFLSFTLRQDLVDPGRLVTLSLLRFSFRSDQQILQHFDLPAGSRCLSPGLDKRLLNCIEPTFGVSFCGAQIPYLHGFLITLGNSLVQFILRLRQAFAKAINFGRLVRQAGLLLAKQCLLRLVAPMGGSNFLLQAGKTLLKSLPFFCALPRSRFLEVLKLSARLRQLLIQCINFCGAISQPLLESGVLSLCRSEGERSRLEVFVALTQRLLGPAALGGQCVVGLAQLRLACQCSVALLAHGIEVRVVGYRHFF